MDYPAADISTGVVELTVVFVIEEGWLLVHVLRWEVVL